MVPTGLPSTLRMGLALRRTGTASWSFLKPADRLYQPQDSAIHIDRPTGQVFFVVPTGFGDGLVGEAMLFAAPSTRAGDGDWQTTPEHGFIAPENSRFTSGPGHTGQPTGVDGRVTYWCANQNEVAASPPILARTCFRTLNAGGTWERRGILFTTGAAVTHQECLPNQESFGALDGNYPQVGPDGALWVMVECGGSVYLARSADEAATFPILKRGGGSSVKIPFQAPAGSQGHREMRIDDQGNLYAFELNGSALSMIVSGNGGLDWSRAINLTAPKDRAATLGQWQVALGRPGEVAFSYLAPHGAGSSASDGFIGVTHNALAADPVVYGSLVTSAGGTALVSKGGPGDDFIDVDLGPDGSPWAAYYADCPASGDTYCDATRGAVPPEGNGLDGWQAEMVAHLQWG